MNRKHLMALIEVSFAVIVWGASFITTKLALIDLSRITVVWLRFSIGVIILGIAAGLRHQYSLPKRQDWLYLAILGFFGITFHQWLQSTGLLTVHASTTAWVVVTTPVFIALLSWLFLHENLDWLQFMGIVLAGLRVLFVVSKGNISGILIGQFGTKGDVLILIRAVNWAVFLSCLTKGLKNTSLLKWSSLSCK